jgi:outer membrane protein TolC
MFLRSAIWRCIGSAGASLVALAACASYTPQPLPSHPGPPTPVADIRIDPARMPFHVLSRHRFDPSDGLDMDEVAMLAVANNPLLKVARDDVGVAGAQAFAAGLLPDPQLALTLDAPTNPGPGNTRAFSLGLSEDILALVTRAAATGAAEAHQREVDLNLLWQEWQVVSQARLLFVRDLEQTRRLRVLRANQALFAERHAGAQRALRDGNATRDAVSADLAALQDVERRINEVERQRNRNRLQLNQLVGLPPATRLELTGDAQLPRLDTEQVRGELARLASRRPDLLALRAGYESQEQRFRQAVLAQFPALNVGLTRARDNSDLYTVGIGVTLSLPIFNRNRGNIEIERATRQRLYDEYRQRLDAAASEVRGLLDDQALLERQMSGVREILTELEHTADGAQAAYQAGNLSEPAYVNLRAALLAKRDEAITLEESILEQRVALQTLLGTEVPVTRQPNGNHPG